MNNTIKTLPNGDFEVLQDAPSTTNQVVTHDKELRYN